MQLLINLRHRARQLVRRLCRLHPLHGISPRGLSGFIAHMHGSPQRATSAACLVVAAGTLLFAAGAALSSLEGTSGPAQSVQPRLASSNQEPLAQTTLPAVKPSDRVSSAARGGREPAESADDGGATEPRATPTSAVPTADDGETLWEQPKEVQDLFESTYGAAAAEVWAEQHNQDLKAQERPDATQTPPDAAARALSAGMAAAAPRSQDHPWRVGIQAGHWLNSQLPDELASLRGSTGASGEGWSEVGVNLDIAQRLVALLRQAGVEADLIPATVPVHYKADAFVALHCDGNANSALSGYKLARAIWSAIPEEDDALLHAIESEYQAGTGLDEHPQTITQNMLQYYAFNNRRLQHAVDPATPAVILEMGFLTNSRDRELLMQQPDRVAQAIANGILKFLSRASRS